MGHALDLKFLHLVVAVAEEGTLTRAGRRLSLTQSALSHQLAELEARFGIEVFRRQGRQLKLTSLGERLLTRARLLLSQVEALEAELSAPEVRRLELRLVTQCFTCYHWLPTLLEPFEAAHPGVVVSLVVESTRHALEALDAGAVDLALTTERREDPRYERQFVFDDELMIALSKDHALVARERIDFADLGNERLLVHPPSDADRRWFQQAVGCGTSSGRHDEVHSGGAAARPRQIQRIPVTDSIIDLTESGYGCALLSRRSAIHAAKAGRIVLRGFSPQPLMREFFAVWRRDEPKRLPMRDFVQAVTEHCRG
jgi:LysR family transcriptional regulator, regulator for metE and metH